MSSRSSVDRAPARCSGDISLSHARVMQINSPFMIVIVCDKGASQKNCHLFTSPTIHHSVLTEGDELFLLFPPFGLNVHFKEFKLTPEYTPF